MNTFQHNLAQLIKSQIEQANYLNTLSEEALNKQSEKKKWSACQCLWHLNSYGDYYIPHLEVAIDRAPSANQPIKNTWLGKQFYKLMKPKEGMVKFKAFKQNTPPTELKDKIAVSVFIEQSLKLLSLLDMTEHKNLNGKVIPVTVLPFIKLTIADVLQFLVIHNERHIQQAMKAAKEANS